jgi:hypothetical protein
MKTGVFLTAFSIVALSVFLVYTRFTDFNHNISISVNEDEETYAFAATYNRANTGAVESYINSKIRPNQLGDTPDDYIDVNTSLPDGTRFYIKESPGRLKIKLDKRTNSVSSYYRIKKMCEGLKPLIAGR